MPEVTEAPLADTEETRHAFQSSPLSAAVRQLESQLQATADDGELVVAVTDPGARILWTYGGAVMRRKAEKVNFIPGGRWDEASVGTNALDLALRLDHAATVYSAEHFSSCVHGWVCWAAPVHDPCTGRQLGVFDLSTTWDRSHPIALATARALARLLGREMRAAATADATPNDAAAASAGHAGGMLELKLLGQPSVGAGRPAAAAHQAADRDPRAAGTESRRSQPGRVAFTAIRGPAGEPGHAEGGDVAAARAARRAARIPPVPDRSGGAL